LLNRMKRAVRSLENLYKGRINIMRKRAQIVQNDTEITFK